MEENWEEAINHVHFVLRDLPLPPALANMFSDSRSDISNSTEFFENGFEFWVMAAGIKAFYTKHLRLPLDGVLPDMVSDSSSYITLHRVYAHQVCTIS